MKIEFNKDEIAVLLAIVISLSGDVKKDILESSDDEVDLRLKAAYLTLEAKVLKVGYEVFMTETSEGVMDAEILDEEE